MRIPGLGLEIRRAPILREKSSLTTLTLSGSGGWFPIVHEPSTGAWQRNLSMDSTDDVLRNPTAWSCVTLIASDVAKLAGWGLNLVEQDADGILTPTDSPAFSPVLRKPNSHSTRIKFFERWMLSKLTHGNTYVLKARDGRGVVTALYILDPARVQVLVAPDGSVFYQLGTDNLSRIEDSIVVPAREIIHDIMVPLFHDLVGVSPVFAAWVSALQGNKMRSATTKLFENGINPGGFLSAPHHIPNDVAERLRQQWQSEYAGQQNIGRLAVGGDGLTYTPLGLTAVDAQLIEQLKSSNEEIADTYHVPGCLLGIAPWPPYTDIQSVNLQYYVQALQNPINNIEILLTEGLELPSPYRIQVDLATLLEMDSKTLTEVLTARVNGGLISINEARAELDYRAVTGGESPMAQQQMFSLAALAERDRSKPFAKPTAPPDAVQANTASKDLDADEIRQKALALLAA